MFNAQKIDNPMLCHVHQDLNGHAQFECIGFNPGSKSIHDIKYVSTVKHSLEEFIELCQQSTADFKFYLTDSNCQNFVDIIIMKLDLKSPLTPVNEIPCNCFYIVKFIHESSNSINKVHTESK